MTGLAIAAGALLALGLIMWAGHRMLNDGGGGTSSGGGGVLGAFTDVFDPARSRAEHDLDSKEHQGEVLPTPEELDLPVRVDLDSRTARIRRR